MCIVQSRLALSQNGTSMFARDTKVTTDCREWTGARSKGYGQKRDKTLGRNVYVHRWVMAQAQGWEAIRGKVVMHLCDNPLCYRYDHLRIGTHKDNSRDMVEKGRHNSHNARKLHCVHGHPFDEENTYVRSNGERKCRACDRRRKAVNNVNAK